MDENCTLQLPDGRILGYTIKGASQGEPVFAFHGLPGSRLESYLYHESAQKLNIKIIAADRPGYGLSTPLRHRTLLQWSEDVVHLADHLGIKSFGVIGISGGAPYALACAATISRRIKNILIVCGLGPLHQTGLAKHMHWPAAINFWLAHHAPILLKSLIGIPLLILAKLHPSMMLINIGLINGSVDRKVLSDSQVRALLNLNIQEAFRQGTTGAAQDMQLYTQPWGFQLTDITFPVEIWHGDAD